ncbi:MAG: dihydropteroate synthase [Deltaproteobacteria bacterium]|nr:dihydropteroate synthase [Deltaproteobacteria bacterium]MBW2014509.1 dihydropteroate synthase [Deltaproteobacteria bacterium]MBW2088865.1 dihydropteroate synthase [Deltaproteobacteria bacterium]
MIIIGEKINATLSSVKSIILNRETENLINLAKKQAESGANFIDVNVGTGVGSFEDEIKSIQWAAESIQEQIKTPLCIDSADPKVLEAGLKILDNKPAMINSAKAEKYQLDAIVPLAAEHNSYFIALAMDESGIPKTVEGRLRCCDTILGACEKYGVSIQNLYIDPLVMPISTDINSGMVTLKTLTAIKEKFPGARTVTGLSNVSYGLPDRGRLNVAYLHMCISAGLDAAIIDPLDQALMAAVKTGEVLAGKDRHCRRYMRAFRK